MFGVELSEIAVKELFEELGMVPEVSITGKLTRYSGDRIDVFLGDLFKLSGQEVGRVDATYDRAALVALPREMRTRYTAHVKELERHYGAGYALTLLENHSVPGGMKGVCEATEKVWLLENR